MLPQGQFQVSTMTYDLEQPQLAHRFSMRDEGTCGNARGYPESMLQALSREVQMYLLPLLR